MDHYSGKKTSCDFCRTAFVRDQSILYDKDHDLAFCMNKPNLSSPSCITRWVMESGRTSMAQAMTFNGSPIIPEYGGEILSCSGCDQIFTFREIIQVDLDRNIALCTATLEDCVDLWKSKIGQMEAVYQVQPYRFHGNT